MTISTFAEAFRRAQWALIRIENENQNNFEKYRTILMIPSIKDDDEDLQHDIKINPFTKQNSSKKWLIINYTFEGFWGFGAGGTAAECGVNAEFPLGSWGFRGTDREVPAGRTRAVLKAGAGL